MTRTLLAAVGCRRGGLHRAHGRTRNGFRRRTGQATRTEDQVLDTSVAAPFQITYGHKTILVADGGTSTVSKLSRKKLYKLFETPEGLGAVGMNARGDTAYGIQQGDAANGGPVTKPSW